MSQNFVQNSQLRTMMLGAYRLYARSQFWRSGPRIFINSIPKAGTHLLTAELEKFPEVQNSRLHLELDRIGTYAANGDYHLDIGKAAAHVRQIRAGQYFSAHMFWTPEMEKLLADAGICSLFMTRDPRDILVSRFHYVMGLRRHHLHDYLTGLDNDDARWRALVLGHEGAPFIRPMRDMLNSFLPWKEKSASLTLRFEDLVGERGGGTVAAKQQALEAMCDHSGLSRDLVARNAATGTAGTATLRKGQANAWRDNLPPAVIAMVHDHCGAEIARMGYAVD